MSQAIFCWRVLLVLLASVSCAARAEQGPNTEQTLVAKVSTVFKSDTDSRSYRYLTLNNALRVLLVSDLKAEKSAAAVNVAVGNNQNPKLRPGLAHFLEHMLFLGTEKYPVAGEYQEFISRYGGMTNAYTAEENTVYYFDIEHKFLEPALDRFAQFFVAPAFNPSDIGREKYAIDAEFMATISDDELREWDVYRNFFNYEHPAANFSVGNADVLADRENHSLRDDLISFYHANYSANLMTVTVIGNQSLHDLQKMVETRFAQVPNQNKPVVNVYPSLFADDVLPLSLNIKSVKEMRKLTVSFPIPRDINDYRAKPWAYVAHLLGSEASGSLFSLLKGLGWAEALSAGEVLTSQQDGLFQISITLTKEGVKAKDQIVSALFENLKIIGARGISDWRFNELKQMGELEFRFQEKLLAIDSAVDLAQAMHDYPNPEVLRGKHTYVEFNEAAIKQALSYLRNDKVMVAYIAPEVTGSAMSNYYQAPYSYVAGIPELLELKPLYRQKLTLPERNIFIPKNTSVKSPLMLPVVGDSLGKNSPALLVNHDQFKLWFMQDRHYRSPKAELKFRFKLPIQNNSLENSARSELFVALVMDQLNEYAYAARLAGLNFSVVANSRGFDIGVSGYTDKQNLLVNRIISTVAKSSFSQDRFEKIKEGLVREWRNRDKNSPYEVLIEKIPRLQVLPYWGSREYAEAAQQLSYESFRTFTSKLLTGAKVDALIFGNLYSQDAIKLFAIVENELLKKKSARLPQLAKVLRSANKNDKSWLYLNPLEHKDHAVVLYVQAQSPKVEDSAHTLLLNHILQGDFFNQLRTEKVLGYTADLFSLPLKNVQSSVFVVQSPKVGGEVIIAEIDAFLVNASARVTDDFFIHKNALLAQLREVPVSLKDQAEKYWGSVLLNDKDFSNRQRLISAVNAITPDTLRRYYAATFLQKNRRLWLSTDKVENLNDFEYIQNVADYQQIQQGYLFP